jgi:AcrR family transcriptional regulator
VFIQKYVRSPSLARKASYDLPEVRQKALNLFRAKGFRGTSLKDLENALDMRPGSIYAAFGSKENLYQDTLALYAETIRRDFEQTMAAAPSALSGVAAYVRGLGAAAGGNPPLHSCMLVKTMLETPDDDIDLRGQAETLIDKMEAAFVEVFRKAQEAGEISADREPAGLARRLLAEIVGLRAYAERRDVAADVALLADEIACDIESLAVT